MISLNVTTLTFLLLKFKEKVINKFKTYKVVTSQPLLMTPLNFATVIFFFLLLRFKDKILNKFKIYKAKVEHQLNKRIKS